MKLASLLQRTVYVLVLMAAGYLVLTEFRQFFIPIALGVMFALMLYPASRQLDKWKVPRVAGNLFLILGSLALVVLAIIALSSIFRSFFSDLPQIQQNFQNNLTITYDFVETKFGVPVIEQQAWVQENLNVSRLLGGDIVGKIFSSTANILYVFGITIVYVFFFLYYRDKFKSFLKMIIPKSRYGTMEKTIDEIDEVAPHFMLGMLLVVVVMFMVNSLGFTLIGVDQPLFLGLVAAMVNIIPFVGTIIGFLIVMIFVLATQSLNVALALLIMFIIVQFFDNNILTPNIAAARIQLNPLVAIMSIVLGNFIWGLIGMFLALPFLAMFKILCDNSNTLRPIGYVLGTEGFHETRETLLEKLSKASEPKKKTKAKPKKKRARKSK